MFWKQWGLLWSDCIWTQPYSSVVSWYLSIDGEVLQSKSFARVPSFKSTRLTNLSLCDEIYLVAEWRQSVRIRLFWSQSKTNTQILSFNKGSVAYNGSRKMKRRVCLTIQITSCVNCKRLWYGVEPSSLLWTLNYSCEILVWNNSFPISINECKIKQSLVITQLVTRICSKIISRKGL